MHLTPASTDRVSAMSKPVARISLPQGRWRNADEHTFLDIRMKFSRWRLKSAKIQGVSSLDSKHQDFHGTILPDMGFPDAEPACGTVLRHAERICLFDSNGCSTHRPRNQLRGVAACRSGASARAAPDRWRPLKVPEDRTARRLSWLDSRLFPARQLPGRLGFHGAPKSLEEMEAGILAEAKRRHAGD